MDIQKFYDTVDSLFSEKRPGDAEKYMLDFLAQAESRGDMAAVVTVSNELGGYYRAVSRYAEGVPLYEKALQIIEKLHQSGSPAHGTTLINYATTCTMSGDREKALSLYRQAADIFAGPGYEEDFNLATLYNNMSFVCQEMDDFAHGEEYLMKALEILKKLEESEIETASTYTNLANIYIATDRLADAKSLLQKAADIYLKETGGRDVHYAAAVSALGDVSYMERRYEEAEDRYSKALQLIARDYGTDNDNYRTIDRNLKLCRQKLQETGGNHN